jgi:hypothetical protein
MAEPVDRSTRGRRANNAGKQYERDVAGILPGGKRIGQYGGPVDVTADFGVIAQVKVGGAFPEVLSRYLTKVMMAAKADETPVVIVGNRPGVGSKRTHLVLLTLEDFVRLLK